jgi:hypothetical protein
VKVKRSALLHFHSRRIRAKIAAPLQSVAKLDEVAVQSRHIHIACSGVGQGHKPNDIMILSRLDFANAVSEHAIGR